MDIKTRIEQIQGLPPEERLDALRELKGELEDEKGKVEGLIDDTLEELNEASTKQEEAPSHPEVEAHLPSGSLEDTVHADGGERQEIRSDLHPAQDYVTQMSYEQLWRQPTQYIYQRANELAEQVYEVGQPGTENVEEIVSLYEALHQKREDIREGVYTTTDEIINQLDTATRIINGLMEKYRT